MKPDAAKRWLRRHLIKVRQRLSDRERASKSARILEHVFDAPFYRRAKTIATFIGFGSEVHTEKLIEQAWKDGKTVLIPMTADGFDKPFFAVFRKGDRLQKTVFGASELVEKKTAYDFRRIDLLIVPGLAFDETGHRLGYGGGVYDRILVKARRALAVGVFFSAQELHRVPVEPHDRRLFAAVTEVGLRPFA